MIPKNGENVLSARNIRDLLNVGFKNDVAFTAPNKPPCSYEVLVKHVDQIGAELASQGLTNSDRVAIVLPNGPEMATAFLAVSSYMSAAPLNPAYKQSEYEFYLEDLNPKLVIVEESSSNPVRNAALKLSIPVAEIKVAEHAAAGIFSLFDSTQSINLPTVQTEALVLHTSGTTSRPKVVPLTQANLVASAFNISNTLKLRDSDHSLNIMPLFHIHGLIAVLCASISAGGSVCCTAGFNALKFYELAKSEKITWYSGVPTMHQAILQRGKRQTDAAKALKLRFIRSSSASLPPAVFGELTELFECPVIEAYGMTEATHQMTSNPLPPEKQKAGFVGLPAGPKVCIMDLVGNQLEKGQEGEVCIQGDNVTPGYDKNPEANNQSFTNGWFRTGDQGVFDEDGYLKITGRLKEIINRGGEKISPLEIDNVLMEHPSIQQVVSFAVADKSYGEEIGVAIVLGDGKQLSESELKSYANDRLARFKIPKHICFVEEIPKGATGKMQRIGLAKKLGLEDR